MLTVSGIQDFNIYLTIFYLTIFSIMLNILKKKIRRESPRVKGFYD